MDTRKPSKDIQLTALGPATPSSKKREIQVRVTFCTHVGWDGVLVLLFSLCIAGLFIYITFLYTKSFRAWHRRWVWLFVLFAGFYVMLILKFLLLWKRLATDFTNQQQQEVRRKREQGEKPDIRDGFTRSMSAIERVKIATVNFKTVYENFQINGQWFLWKLYASELFDSAQQCANLVTVYLCSLPVEWTVCIAFGLSAYSAHTAMTVLGKNTPARRDRQVKLDVIADFLCVAIPLCVLWFAYNIPLSISEMLSITMLPTFSILLKLDDILEEVIKSRSATHLLREQSFQSFSMKRKRTSMFREVQSVKMAQEQESKIPRRARLVLAGSACAFSVFFFVVAVAHLAMRPSGCDTITWEKGCVNKIPFCKSLFTPTCNCASLEIKNDYKLVALPSSLVDTMTGLRKVFVRNCNLTALPPRMEQLTEMVDFEVSFSQLQSFHVDVGKWEKLNKLHLQYNNITQYNENALWTHSNVAAIFLLGNKIRQIPFFASYLPSLNYLHIGENNIDIEVPLSKKQFPSLVFLYVNGNNLIEFPDESLGASLVKLGVARCNLKTLPQYLSNFNVLKYLDARDNNITFVDNALKVLMKTNKVESYFAGNDVCKRDKSLDCEPLCSKYCWSREVLDDGICDETCNTKICQFDGGDCK